VGGQEAAVIAEGSVAKVLSGDGDGEKRDSLTRM